MGLMDVIKVLVNNFFGCGFETHLVHYQEAYICRKCMPLFVKEGIYYG